MKIDITDLKSIENQIEEHEVTAGFSSFRSRMGEFPITKRTVSSASGTKREPKPCSLRENKDYDFGSLRQVPERNSGADSGCNPSGISSERIGIRGSRRGYGISGRDGIGCRCAHL